jgi:hypothetical protein
MTTRLSSFYFSKVVGILALSLSSCLLSRGAPGDEIGAEHASVRAALAAQGNVTGELMRQRGVLGTAVGVDDNGQVSLVVYVEAGHPGAGAVKLPAVKGVPVQVELTDRFRAMVGKPGGGGSTAVSHTAAQTPPIQLGTSGGWRSDLANGYCCGGTLGSLIQVNGVKFILSNYHVFESDVVLGGNGVVATDGDSIIQPGLIDVNCRATNSQDVATLRTLHSLPLNNIDVGVAQIVPGMVREDGAILEIGTISSSTVAASLNKAVKKSGRTSGLTRSKISGLNATISVSYENECAGQTIFTRVYTGQIVVAKGGTFLKAGDSGSLMVEDVTTNPRAIGLLYAGSSTSAIANPIGPVLTFVGSQIGGAGVVATMVGN